MPDLAEVAVETALLARATAFATAQNLTISMPNVAFTPPLMASPPVPISSLAWLRATFMPAPAFEMGIAFNAPVQHYGIMQIDVFYGQGAGETAAGRIAAAAISYFSRGTAMVSDGFTVEIIKKAFRGPLIKSDPWVMIPVSIPFVCFTRSA